MSIPCPRCQQALTPGAPSCAHCGASLLIEVDGAEPACAIHPTLRSLGTCDRCGAFACAMCLRVDSRGQVLCQNCHEREPDVLLPWDRREELGTFMAFWKTFVEVLLRPGSFSTVRAEGSVGSSLLFALLSSLPSSFVTGVTYLGLFSFMTQVFPVASTQPEVEQRFQWVGLATFAFCVLVIPPLTLVFTLLNAGVDHLFLRMGGITRDFAVTLRANALSQAPMVLGGVPIIGAQVAPFWVLVARVFAYRGLHRTTWGVAAVGALAAPLTFCMLCGGGYIALILLAVGRS
ncbi:YIP1 family protein [Archangium violaceum]|uniref:YIP1 family protein n=1 Tax=Archangium violaceum TaxID=83451 RepID=UPI0019518874|nr:YIP1 family protein [Archangium violaceum]QRN98827.1 YIP1 family protein [Archangium violaceum]